MVITSVCEMTLARGERTHIHVNMSGTTLRDPPYSEALSAVQVLNK